MSIGKNIKRLRQNRGITQEQLAGELHLSGQAVSKWENETTLPDITLLPLLAEYFGVTIDELLDYRLNALTYKERKHQGAANPEVKMCCEAIADQIIEFQPKFSRELFLKIKN